MKRIICTLWLAWALVPVRWAATAQTPVEASAKPHVVRPLILHQSRYRIRAGEPTKIRAPRETLDFVLGATNRSVRVSGQRGKSFVAGPSTNGDEVLLAASLAAEPGEYRLELSVENEAGEEQVTMVDVTVDPLQAVPSTATKSPVVLLNGWQSIGCPPATGPAETFGRALVPELVFDGVPVVYFFDNCVECPNCLIEDIGNALGRALNLIRYDTGALVPQVDLIGQWVD